MAQKWSVIHYCPILPCCDTVKDFNTKEKADAWVGYKMRTRKDICCIYYAVGVDIGGKVVCPDCCKPIINYKCACPK